MLRRAVVAAAVLVVAFVNGVAAAPAWVRVQTTHFTVSGNVGEKRAREVAARLEQFRVALLRVFPGARLSVRRPFVVAFDGEKSYGPLKPLHDGKPAPVAGYFSWNSDGSCVTLQLDRGEESYPIIYHEYAHLFLSGASRRLPLWIGEGLAEYYSTTEVAREGREVHLGIPVVRHVRYLRGRGLMPLRSLLTTRESSKLWEDAEDAALFYAESWALVHQIASEPGGGEKIAAFINKVAAGRPDVEVFEEIFGPLNKAEGALQHYVQSAVYRYTKVVFPQGVEGERAPARTLTGAETEVTKAIVLIYLGRHGEAASHLDAALKAEPGLVEAQVAQGLLARRQDRQQESERLFRAAVEKAPGNLDAAFYWGLSLVEMRDVDRATLERGRAALAAALPANDPPADALAVLGVLNGQVNRLDEAESLLRRSMQLMPGQTRTTAGLADVLIREGKYDEARDLLGPMIARPSYPGEDTIARRLLGWLSQVETRAKLRDELAKIAASEPPSAANGTKAGEEPGQGTRRSPDRIPVYRVVGAGEQRQVGVLAGIECSRDGLVFVVRTASGTSRYYAPRFEDVDFISYRQDLTGRITCGPQAAPPVFVTWKAADGTLPAGLETIAGRAVAIEFLAK